MAGSRRPSFVARHPEPKPRVPAVAPHALLLAKAKDLLRCCRALAEMKNVNYLQGC